MRWRTFWLFVLGLGSIDALALGGWTVIGWGLRGSAHDGTPEADVLMGQGMIVGLLSAAALAHVALGLWGVLKQRSDAWIASIAVAVLVPITLPIGILVVGGGLRLLFG